MVNICQSRMIKTASESETDGFGQEAGDLYALFTGVSRQ